MPKNSVIHRPRPSRPYRRWGKQGQRHHPAGRDQDQKETAEDLGVDPKDLDQALQEAMKQM